MAQLFDYRTRMSFARSIRQPDLRSALPLSLVIVFVTLLWFAGGASRGDALGQAIVRGGAWAMIVVVVLTGRGPNFSSVRPVGIILVLAIALPLLQLIPLPPAWWQELPGRDILLIPDAGAAPWRPLTMTPAATRNALSSLIVPAVMLLLFTQMTDAAAKWLLAILLTVVASASFLGLLQFAGVTFNNPLINETPGQVSGIFANRNHFALLLAIGCLLAPVWAFQDRNALVWKGPLAASLALLFILMILATGSRSGILLGLVAIGLAVMLVGQRMRRLFKHAPKWAFPALIAIIFGTIAGGISLSIAADRAMSVQRLVLHLADDDLRTKAMPTILSMIRIYFPVGSGLGGFDQIFRIHEPLALLKPTYFNQAHNDFIGVALDAGLPGIALTIAAAGWWLVASIRAWRRPSDELVVLARLGSSMLLLILVASTVDYPGRTPTFMAISVIAAVWLARGSSSSKLAPLPPRDLDL